MASKRVRVSSDNTTFYTLPGASGEKRTDISTFDDTVFGQDYKSENVSMSEAMISGNAYYKGVAGYTAVIRKGGTPTAMTAEACSLVSGKTYQVTSTVKRIIDYGSALTVLDNAVDKTAFVLSIDYLSGTITFLSSYTPTGPITLTGKYVPTTQLAKGRSFTLTQQCAPIDNTTYEVAQANSAWRTFTQGLRSVQFEMGGIHDAADTFLTDMNAGTLLYLEVTPNGGTDTLFRGFFKRTNHAIQGNVGALEAATFTFTLYVPDGSLVAAPFLWYFTSSTMNMAIQKVITSFQNGTNLYVQYLPDGLTGTQFSCVTTECSLTNQMEGQNEFRFNFRASGAPTTI